MSASKPQHHPESDWGAQAQTTLKRAGYSRGGAREAVIDYLDRQQCARSAQEIHGALRRSRRGVSIASVYRALEVLQDLRLVQRVEVGQAEALYEPMHSSGEHHHHVVCENCARIVPFEDPALERAITRLSRQIDFDIDAHDVVLHGRCPRCRAADPARARS
jgi:Fur family transcriptional regulator, ferric uptake regulator